MKAQDLQLQKYINAVDKNEIVFTKGATEAINLVANTFGQKFLKEGDEILITELEHHSNYVPWHFLRKSKGIKIEFAEVNNNGEVTIESIKKKITSKTKLIAVTHIIKCYRCNFANQRNNRVSSLKRDCSFSRWLPRCSSFKTRYAILRL